MTGRQLRIICYFLWRILLAVQPDTDAFSVVCRYAERRADELEKRI